MIDDQESSAPPQPRTPIFRSLRWRIQFWHAAILLMAILIFACLVFFQRQYSVRTAIDDQLLLAARVLSEQLATIGADAVHPNNPDLTSIRIPAVFGRRRFRRPEDEPYMVISSTNGKTLCTDGYVPTYLIDPNERSATEQEDFHLEDHRSFREVAGELSNGIRFRIGRDVGPEHSSLRNLALALLAGGVIVLGMGLVGGYVLSARLTAPIREISQVASELSESTLSNRITLGETDVEFESLATTLNSTFARLDDAFQAQQAFVADASHELRTPLSVIQTHQQLALSQNRTPEEYQETLRTCQFAAKRMQNLVDSLLTLARLDSDTLNPTHRHPVDLSTIAWNCIAEIQPLAESRSIQIVSDIDEGLNVRGNPAQLRQLLFNLLDNAVKYSESNQQIAVKLKQVDQLAVASIQDYGPGIPDVDIPRIFDRFYRVDKQRSSRSGGAGLGLAICKSIVDSHLGQLHVTSQIGQGSVFRVEIPVA